MQKLENDIVRQFAIEIERNSVAIAKLQKGNSRLTLVSVVLGIGLVVTGTELYLFEKRENERRRVKKDK